MPEPTPSQLLILFNLENLTCKKEIVAHAISRGVRIATSLKDRPAAVFSDTLSFLNSTHGLDGARFYLLCDDPNLIEIPYIPHLLCTQAEMRNQLDAAFGKLRADAA